MKKVIFLEQDCVGVKVLSQKISERLGIFQYSGQKKEYGRKQKNGKYKILTEDQIAHEHLEAGKGVQYKGYIYFLGSIAEKSEHYASLKQSYKRIESKVNRKVEEEFLPYLNGALYEGLKDVMQFSMVKSMIDLYEANVFSYEWLEQKLTTYLKPESVAIVLYELHESNRQAG